MCSIVRLYGLQTSNNDMHIYLITNESKLGRKTMISFEVSRFQFHMTSLGGKSVDLVASSKAWERRRWVS